MAITVTATGNHYFLDSIVGVLVALTAFAADPASPAPAGKPAQRPALVTHRARVTDLADLRLALDVRARARLRRGDALFPFFPSETAAIAAGVHRRRGRPEHPFVIAAAAAGAFIGDNSSYAVGRTAGRDPGRSSQARRAASGSSARSERSTARRLLARRGPVHPRRPDGRDADGRRDPDAWTRFLRYTAVAAVLWASFAGGLGYLGGRAFEEQPARWSASWRRRRDGGVHAAIALGVEVVRRHSRTPARRPPTGGCSEWVVRQPVEIDGRTSPTA